MSKYNGWANFETWRVKLEFLDGTSWSDFMEKYDEEFHDKHEVVGDLAGRLQMHVDDVAYQYINDNVFVISLVDAFLYEVDWDEIALAMFEDEYPDALKPVEA